MNNETKKRMVGGMPIELQAGKTYRAYTFKKSDDKVMYPITIERTSGQRFRVKFVRAMVWEKAQAFIDEFNAIGTW